MSNIIGSVISEAFYEFNENVGKEAIYFLSNLIRSSTNVNDMKEEFKVFCKDNLVLNEGDIDKAYSKLISKIKGRNETTEILPTDHPILNQPLQQTNLKK